MIYKIAHHRSLSILNSFQSTIRTTNRPHSITFLNMKCYTSTSVIGFGFTIYSWNKQISRLGMMG